METAKKKVTFEVTISDNALPLPGTAAWLAQQIGSGVLSVNVTKKGSPGVWLRFGENHEKSQLLALYQPDSIYPDVTYFPFPESFGEDDREGFGVYLTKGGMALAMRLGKKAATLLKSRLRSGDRSQAAKFNLKLVPITE